MLPASATCEALKKTGSSLGYAPIASMPSALIPTEVRYFTYADDQRMTQSFPKYPRLPVIQCSGYEPNLPGDSSPQNEN